MTAEPTSAGTTEIAAAQAAGRLEPRPLVFRANGRRVAFTALLAVGIAAAVGVATDLPLGISLLGAIVFGLAYYGLTWWVRIGSFGIRVDERGIHRRGTRDRASIGWSELQSIDLAETPVMVRGRPVRLRYVVLESRGRERILFADLSPIGSPAIRIELEGPQPITDVADSGVLLAVIADRAGDDRYLPEVLLEHARPPVDGVPDGQAPAAGTERHRVGVGGFLALLAKIGTKLAKGVPAALKTFKVGPALASAAVYGVLLSWQFALAIMVMLAFHEYGHVHAMRRAGLKVRGIYFIPLLGAAAVSEDTWRTRSEQARIALAGPLWGLGLTAVAALVDAATGFAYPAVGVVVAWWALLNLFNLLPVNPLDGGRVLAAVGYSLGSRLGILLSLGMFVGALVLAWVFEITLLAIVGAVGLLEFASEAGAAIRFRQITSSPRVAALSPAGLATLKGLARPSLGEDADQALFHYELRQSVRLRRMARVTPMTRGQVVRWAAAYFVVTAVLLALLLAASTAHPDALLAREILR
ncbi:MAG: hypothetical protein JXB32_02050 [Deltaproteobacteria bacterium]|nr:hypothetical protein [Deltaproteobacteria bacterium]